LAADTLSAVVRLRFLRASQLLRHKNISVTMTAYIKADRTALANGMKLLEESLSKE